MPAAYRFLIGTFQAVGHPIKAYLDQVIPHIKYALNVKNSKLYSIQALTCVSMLASAVGPAMQPHMHELLDLMFGAGLNQTLIDSLAELAVHIPSLLPSIQDKLMDHLSMVLAGKPFIHPGNRGSKFTKNASAQTAPLTVQQVCDIPYSIS
jgi:FKBP12-rapamycin complex-associated protein